MSESPADELKRLRKIEKAAAKLWKAHCRSHDALLSPQKFGMNYGELLDLGVALGFAERSAALHIGEKG